MAIAIFSLGVVFVVGFARVRRLVMLNFDDYRWLVGMTRLRPASLELHPELEPNSITSQYDDLPGALETLGLSPASAPTLGTVFHGAVTLPGMVSVIVASVGAAIGGLAAVGFGAPTFAVVLAGALAFADVVYVMFLANSPSFRGF